MHRHLPLLSSLLAGLALAGPSLALALETSAGPVRMDAVLTGLEEPWAIAFLPDGRPLITERDGRLLLVTDGQTSPISGLPEVYAEGQGGLGSRLIDPHSQNMMVAARATAERKTLGRLSYRVATLRQSFSLPNMISMRLRRL